MTLLTTIFILLVGAATAIAALQTLRSAIPGRQKVVFIVIRVLIAALLIVACLEPVLTLQRLPPRDRSLTVLVDASSSMSLFCTDSSVEALLDNLRKAGTMRRQKLQVLLFGDSLREKKLATHYSQADRKSNFPSISEHPALQNSAQILLISDGNWSNSRPVAGTLAEKSVNFLSLSQRRNPASIGCDAPDTVMCAAGTRCSVSIVCSGYATTTSAVTIEATEHDQPVFVDTIPVDPGSYAREIRVRLPALAAGVHLFRISLTNSKDAVFHRRYMMCRAVPVTFAYSITAGAPSIDERFLRLALAAMPAFKEVQKQGNLREQVRFIVHNPDVQLPPAAVLPVFIGCLPAVSARADTITGDRLYLPAATLGNPLDGVLLKDMPPIVPLAASPQIAMGTIWLAARTAHGETIPLLYSALFQRRTFIACAFDGVWRWDFLPMSHLQGEADMQTFSRRLLEITRGRLMAAGDDTTIVWPVGGTSTFSPLKFASIFPRNNSTDTASRVVCSITGRNSAYRQDTTFPVAPDGPFMHYFTMPSPEPGDYTVRCTLSTPVRQYQSAVPFTVTAENPELLVNGQNITLLREIGQPINFGDTARMATMFDYRDGSATGQPIEERYPVKRSWWILGMLFVLFGIEWVMRRSLHLD